MQHRIFMIRLITLGDRKDCCEDRLDGVQMVHDIADTLPQSISVSTPAAEKKDRIMSEEVAVESFHGRNSRSSDVV